MKIGVMVESFRVGLDKGLDAAVELGADGVQMYATEGETRFDALDASARADLKKKVMDRGLEFSAICGDFGGEGFQIAEDNPVRIDDSKRVMDFSLDLGCNVVTTHIGAVPAEKSSSRYAVMAKACEELGRYGESTGATFAIETGPEPSSVLRAFLDDIGLSRGLGVNFDPANLAMVIAEDIPAAVERLGPYIVHTHAKDGVQRKPCNPEDLYGNRLPWDEYITEVPLGEGAVPFERYIEALRKTGFDGYLTIEREVGEYPRKDIAEAMKFLQALLT